MVAISKIIWVSRDALGEMYVMKDGKEHYACKYVIDIRRREVDHAKIYQLMEVSGLYGDPLGTYESLIAARAGARILGELDPERIPVRNFAGSYPRNAAR